MVVDGSTVDVVPDADADADADTVSIAAAILVVLKTVSEGVSSPVVGSEVEIGAAVKVIHESELRG